jgi:antitoxin HicB
MSWPRKLERMSIGREYEIVLQPEPEGGFSVFVPELPSVATQGKTVEEATEMAKEAIEGYLEVMQEDGLPIPAVQRSRVAVQA